MNWIESIKEVKKAQDNDRLVIFVGAGVSANSKLPNWSQLIADIANRIGYKGICDKCERNCETPSECSKRNYSSDEYLKIPELFFQDDLSDKHTDYYAFIKDRLVCDAKSNEIDSEILNILPHHIITTNYDNLLETANSINTRLYTVVSEDRDLLSSANSRYILKMHGDLKKEGTIVLKESDYINYEHTHILISTFIKSLLINHTFLFVGYSLNDYNLKLIIGWINYLANIYGISDRPQNILIQYNKATDSDINYFKRRNINIIDLETMPTKLVELANCHTAFDNDIGNKLLAYLKCINHSDILQKFIPLESLLREKYLYLSSYKKISYTDFLKASEFKEAIVENNTLLVNDPQEYDSILGVLSSPNNSLIIETFARAQITDVVCPGIEPMKAYTLSEEIKEDKLFHLYLNNQYQEIISVLPEQNADVQIYYYKFFDDGGVNYTQLVNKDENDVNNTDLALIFCKKTRARLALITLFDKQKERYNELIHLYETTSPSIKYSIAYLMDNFVIVDNSLLKQMADLLEKQEDKYRKGNGTLYLEGAFSKIIQTKTIAYNFYYYFKLNYLPIDHYTDAKDFLSFYLRAILCTYSHPPITKTDSIIPIENDYRVYPLSCIDFDMMVKFTDPKTLKLWIRKYSVYQLEFDDNLNLEEKFSNLCKSGNIFKSIHWAEQVQCFAILLCHCDNTAINADSIFDAIIIALDYAINSRNEILSHIIEAVDMIVQLYCTASNICKEKMLRSMVMVSNMPFECLFSISTYVERIIKRLSNSITPSIQELLNQLVESIDNKEQKHFLIHILRKVLPKDIYGKYINDNLRNFKEWQIFSFVVDSIIPYSSDIQEIYTDLISKQLESQQKIPGYTKYPIDEINRFLILMLLGYPVDLSSLTQYKGCSDFLDFALDPDNFDYSKVNTAYYMWGNFIYSSKYKPFFINHRKEILTDSLENVFRCDAELTEQQKIVYGILLSDDELKGYGV